MDSRDDYVDALWDLIEGAMELSGQTLSEQTKRTITDKILPEIKAGKYDTLRQLMEELGSTRAGRDYNIEKLKEELGSTRARRDYNIEKLKEELGSTRAGRDYNIEKLKEELGRRCW